MTASAHGSMRATDADREAVQTVLRDAHAEGRLSWDEFDARTTALLSARTYDDLAALTADLPHQVPVPWSTPGSPSVRYPPGRTNPLAITSLACGIGQIAFGPLAGIPAIVVGHMARRQIRRTGEDGGGMALAGLLLGYAGVALTVLLVSLIVALGVAASHQPMPMPGPGVPPGP